MGGGRGTGVGRGSGVAIFIIDVFMQQTAVVGKASQVVENLPTVFAFVDLVASMSVDVCSEVVSPGVPSTADVAAKRLFPSVDAHVSTEVRGSDKFAPTHFAGELPLWFGLCELVTHHLCK